MFILFEIGTLIRINIFMIFHDWSFLNLTVNKVEINFLRDWSQETYL